MIVVGVDAGSRMTKIVLWDRGRGAVAATGSVEHHVDQGASARELRDTLLRQVGRTTAEVQGAVATGYGRNLVDFADTTITEITCHARGVREGRPEVRTIIEIGGQDSKLIRLDERGHVRDFMMNDRCAAGTGRFLEMVAQRVGVGLGDLGGLARASGAPAVISSMCVVFAETEIIGLLAGGRQAADVVAGVQAAIAVRVGGMVGRRLEQPVCFTGGVAMVPGMVEALQKVLSCPVDVVPEPMFTGAVGAAILAAERCR